MGLTHLVPIAADNLLRAITAARVIFPYVPSDPEASYRASVVASDPRWVYYLASVNGDVVGITGHYRDMNYAEALWLGWFGVLPEHRGHGYGSSLLLATMQRMRELGARQMRLWSHDRDEERAGQRLYRRHGLTHFGDGVEDGEPVHYLQGAL